MIDRKKLADDLTDAFIQFQWRTDNPFPIAGETMEKMVNKYRSDQIFYNKVTCIVSGVMRIIAENEVGSA